MKYQDNYLVEAFVKQYLLIISLFPGDSSFDERNKIFKNLAKVFCLTGTKTLDAFFEKSELEYYRNVTDYQSYSCLCRIIEFSKLNGQPIELNDNDRVILAQLKEAMKIKTEEFKLRKCFTAGRGLTALSELAALGNINSFALLGYLEYNGIIVQRNKGHAIECIRMSGSWNDLFANLLGIAYDEERCSEYYENLYTVMKDSGKNTALSQIAKVRPLSLSEKTRSSAAVIEKAFELNIIKRQMYNRQFARIAFSSMISSADKMQLLVAANSNMIASMADLPFDAKKEIHSEFERNCLETMPLRREGGDRFDTQKYYHSRAMPI